MAEIEQAGVDERARKTALARTRSQRVYQVQAGVFSDPGQAQSIMVDLTDAGFDSTLVSEDRGGVVLYEVQLAPYEDLDQASDAVEVLQRTYDLEPELRVLQRAEPEEEVEP